MFGVNECNRLLTSSILPECRILLPMKCIAVVLCCAVALAQTSPTPNPRQASADQSNGPGFANCCKIAVEMLTDTMGVDFGPYLKPFCKV